MRENSLIKENILKYLDLKGVTKYEFYQKTGVSNGVLSQKNGFSEENIMRFLSYYKDINIEWLLTGKGSMLKSNVTHYKSTEVDENNILSESLIDNYGKKNGIPLVSVTAIGGFSNAKFSIEERDVKAYYHIPKFDHKHVDFMIEVEGSSMYPKYNSGDVVACRIIRENSFIQWNKTHVIATKDQGIIIKRIKQGSAENLLMVSDNKDYDPFEVNPTDIDGLALVVGVIRLE
jgi:repressor LexA